MSRRGSRGSGIPETAITISVGLLFMFGLIRVALVGYLQLSADGAAYLAAHEYTMQQLYSASINPQAVTSNAFPAIAQTNIITSSSPAPPPVVPPAIAGYYTQFNQNSRQGGISGVRPAQALAVVTPPPVATLNVVNGGVSINVSGAAIEPLMQTMNTYFNIAGTSLNGNTASNYFSTSSKVNTPPYLVGFNLLSHCTTIPGAPATCRSNQAQSNFYEIGTAAFLDAQNWNEAVQDASQSTGVFCDVFYHQQVFAQLVANGGMFPAQFPRYTSNPNAYNPLATSSPLWVMYNRWDVLVQGGSSPAQQRTQPNLNAAGTAVCQA